ncbi:uncharacterized protein [Rutidosis leptorrhynchoides]|uniref:uncharacterized protein n=1 Tax=Rutidosis leptorrhynchoides TaxID=125765 RepID=UPI003A995F39
MEVELFDMPLGGAKFTRINKRGTKLSCTDRALVSHNVLDTYSDLTLTALKRGCSDHTPIRFHGKLMDFGPTPFKFFHSWLQYEGLSSVVNSVFCSHEFMDVTFQDRFKLVKGRIKSWVKEEKKNPIIHILSHLNALESLLEQDLATEAQKEERLNLFHQLNLFKKVEEMDVFQKARVKWNLEGDENTKFFYGLINQKGSKKMLRGNG